MMWIYFRCATLLSVSDAGWGANKSDWGSGLTIPTWLVHLSKSPLFLLKAKENTPFVQILFTCVIKCFFLEIICALSFTNNIKYSNGSKYILYLFSLQVPVRPQHVFCHLLTKRYTMHCIHCNLYYVHLCILCMRQLNINKLINNTSKNNPPFGENSQIPLSTFD